MRFGFIIDQNRCIGCHACTVACKAEHNIPIGVNRTWVKYIEKGTFPNTSRHFAVLRCNHCDDAPCVEICPTIALFRRPDGIVDFDGNRCIGCKSCMQACPYDALYIDPDSNTAAKCNFCAHRVETGLKPACEIVCPTQAIISGDLDDPGSSIRRIVAAEKVSVRKPEKGTDPKLFYVGVEGDLLHPIRVTPQPSYLWAEKEGAGERERGRAGEGESERVGEWESGRGGEGVSGRGASASEPGASATGPARVSRQSNVTLAAVATPAGPVADAPGSDVDAPLPLTPSPPLPLSHSPTLSLSPSPPLSSLVASREVYNIPHPQPWGRMIASYLWTKSIAAGVLLVAALLAGIGYQQQKELLHIASPALAVIFTGITVLLLVLDLKRPERFFYLLIKPNFKSWLVLGGYILILYGGAATLCLFFGARGIPIPSILFWAAAVLAIASACYSAFLFAQAKGRDLWQSPLFLWHLLAQAITAGAATLIICGTALQTSPAVIKLMSKMLGISLTFTLALVLGEVFLTPVTEDVRRATDLLKTGSLSRIFWGFMLGLGVLMPLALLLFSAIQTDASSLFPVAASVLALMGLWVFEDLWIKAGQAVPLS